MQQTEHFQLNQWAASDRIQMEDFNSDNEKIEAALKSHADALASHTTALAKLGNCQIYTTTYTGSGTGATTLTFPKAPLFITIMGSNMWLVAINGITTAIAKNAGNGTSKCDVIWSGTSVSLTDTENDQRYQCNTANVTYKVIALMDCDT